MEAVRMMRAFALLAPLILACASALSLPYAAAEVCDPGLQENPGCCDRDPENGELCCTEPTETQYVYEDGSYACLDCDPDPTAPECCPEGTTWWEYPNGSYDCLPYFVVMPMPESASAEVGDAGTPCGEESWAEDLAAWVVTDGEETRPRCIRQNATTEATTGHVFYDTRYGEYGIVLTIAAPNAGPSTAAASDETVAVTGYSGVGTDCGRCPPGGLLLQTDCLIYYDGRCVATSIERDGTAGQPLPLP